MPSESVTFSSLLRDKVALIVIAASLLLRLLLSALVGPGFDEAYYAVFAENPAWGYFDHPPFVAAVAGLGYWLTGTWTPLTLRLGAVLIFTLALPGFYLLAGRLFGRSAGRFALLLPHATPFFLVGAGAFVIPDNALVFCWIWALLVAERIRNSARRGQPPGAGFLSGGGGRTLLFLLLGALAGLAMTAKYHAVLLPASLVVASVYDRELRRWWLDWRLYMALIVAGLVFMPVVAWNAANGWISFAEQFGKGASGGFRIRFDLLGQAVGGQLGYLTPWVAVALWIGAFKATASRNGKAGRERGHRPESARWLLAFFLVPVIGMTLIGLTRGILPHWTMPGYVAALVLAAGGFAWTRRVKRNLAAAVAVNLLLVAVVIVQAATGIIALQPKQDPTLDPAGWAAALDSLEAGGHLDREDDVLFAHKWFTAGEMAFADKTGRPIVLLGDRPHMYAWWAPEPLYKGRSGVFLTQRRYDLDPDQHLVPRFDEVQELPLDSVRHRGRWVRMRAWRVHDLRVPRVPPYGPHARPDR